MDIKIAQRIAVQAKEKFRNQSDFAKAVGMTQGGVSQYFTGKRVPSVENLPAISRALGVSMEYLLTGEYSQTNDGAAEEWKNRALAAEAKLAQLSALLGQSAPVETPTLREVTTLKKPKKNFTPSPDIVAGASTETKKRIKPNADEKSA